MKVVTLLTSALAIVACRPSATPAPIDRSAIVDSVTVAMQSYAAAFSRRDSDAVIETYAEDPDFRVYFEGQAFQRTQMDSLVRAMLGGLRTAEATFGDIQVSVIASNAAVATTTFLDVLVDTTGSTTRLRGLVSWTWLRLPDGWRILHGNAVHVPDNAPGGGTS